MSRARRTPLTRLREEDHDDAIDRIFPRATLKPRPTAQPLQKQNAQPPVVRKEEQAYPQRIAISRPPALTEREEKVRRILLKELGGLSETGVGGLSYVEKQRLEQTLDVEYLDREIAKMKRLLGQMKRWGPWMGVGIALLAGALSVPMLMDGEPAWVVLLCAFSILISPLSLVFGYRGTRRRLYIFEALRALSDADEMDVVLDRVTLDADRLISEITHHALAAESKTSRSFR